MKFYTEYKIFNTRNQYELVNITGLCEEVTKKSEIKEGMLLVSAMHITAGVFINDNVDLLTFVGNILG